MEAREDSPRAGVELERLVDGHIGGKLLLVHHRSITFATTPLAPHKVATFCGVRL